MYNYFTYNMEYYYFNMNFETFFIKLIKKASHRNRIISIFENFNEENVVWEFPPYCSRTANNKAEFMLAKTCKFKKTDSSSFDDHFIDKSNNDVCVFYNISRDTKLITIKSEYDMSQTYMGHIGAFMNNAPIELKHKLLISIGEQMMSYTNNHCPAYLSTHGHGVPWLHIRISNKPKYYKNSNYANLIS